MSEQKIKVLLVDDHTVVRAGFRMLLTSQPFIGDIVDIDRGELATQEYQRFQPDVVVMDLSMPGIGGLEAIRRLCRHDENVVVLVYSIHDDAIYVERALEAGAKGYVTKNSAAEVLAEAVAVVAQGNMYVEKDLLSTTNQNNGLSDVDEIKARIKVLSPREFDVFYLLAKGLDAHEVAKELCLGYKTISNHSTQIKKKLNANTAADLAHIAMVSGVI